MTTFLLYLFYLIAPPRDTLLCSLWVSRAPTSEQVSAACGQIELEQQIVKLTNIWSGDVWCQGNASIIYNPFEACQLAGISLDNFRMEIYEPASYEQIICSVTSYSPAPTFDEIRAACGAEAVTRWQDGEYEFRQISVTPAEQTVSLPPAPLPGAGLLEQPGSPAELATAEPLHVLAWHVSNTAEWQNRYDAEIFSAAQKWHVPPRLLKELIMAETQFYPATGAAGEIGLVQLTEGGIDLMLLYTLPGYAMQTPARREVLRGEVILQLACDACPERERAEAARDDFEIYARALAAYYLCYGDWDAALTAWNIKHSEIIKG